MKSLKILSYNIHKGKNLAQEYILKQIKSSISSVGADLVLLQEVVGNSNKITTSQFEFLADSIWDHYAYGRNAVKNEYNHGNAILSKYPILKWENVDISSSKLESRGILYAYLEIEKVSVHVFCLHLSLRQKDRVKQLQRLSTLLKDIPSGEPIIVGGDFNDWNKKLNSQMNEIGLEMITLPKTFPSFYPLLPLDRIYVRNIKQLKVEVLTDKSWRELSDHLALLVEIEL